MPNSLREVERLARSFIDAAVHEGYAPTVPNDIVPSYLTTSNQCEGMALALMRLQDEYEIASTALSLAAVAAKESRLRRLALMGLIYSKYRSVDDFIISAGFDPDDRLKRLALECAIYRKSSKLATLCDLLISDADPELARVSTAVRNGEVIPFLELESPGTLGLGE